MPEKKQKYKIMNVIDTTELQPDGTKKPVTIVSYSTPVGRIGTVKIPAEKYSESAIKEAIKKAEAERPKEIGKIIEI